MKTMVLNEQELERSKIVLRETRDAVANLSKKVCEAGIESSFKEGRYHHDIAYGIDMPLLFARGFLDGVSKVLENPEVGKAYSIFHPIKRSRARKATQAAEQALAAMPFDRLEELYSKAREALTEELRPSILYLASGLTNRAGQEVTDEDRRMLAPVFRVDDFLKVVYQIKGAYSPAV